jgi:hypothetical protein
MNEAAISPTTLKQINKYTDNPAHMLILVGVNGVGKTRIAEGILSNLLGVTNEKKIRFNRYTLFLEPVNGVIPIDAVRDVQRFLRLKTTGVSELRRGIVIEHSEALTIEAQNALLKVLEEPPMDTAIIMTVHSANVLLPTIYSRSQSINVNRPSKSDLFAYFTKKGYQDQDINRMYSLTNGLPGLMSALLGDDQSHPLLEAVKTAKELLETTRYSRLTQINALSKDRPKIIALVYALQRIAQASLAQSIKKGSRQSVMRWHNILSSAIKAQEELSMNSNAKLVLCNLFMAI